MAIPKFQHFISQMQAKRFTDENGRFYVYNKRARKVIHTTPKNVFAESHLYTIENAKGEKDTSLETKFSELEGVANSIINKIVTVSRSGGKPSLTEEERANFDLFFYMQWKRVPDIHAKMKSIQESGSLVDEYFTQLRAKYPEKAAEIDALDTPAERKRLLQGGKVRGIETLGQEVLGVLANRGLVILRITAPGECFAIGSLPIVRKSGDLRAADSEVWMPVASDIAVGFGGPQNNETLLPIDDPSKVLNINRVTAAQSTSFAAVSKDVVESLAAFSDSAIGTES